MAEERLASNDARARVTFWDGGVWRQERAEDIEGVEDEGAEVDVREGSILREGE